MQFRYDSEADVAFLVLRDPEGGDEGGQRLDERRYRHLDQAGNVYAYEFLFVSRGVSFDGIDPEDATLIRKAISAAIKSIEPLAVA